MPAGRSTAQLFGLLLLVVLPPLVTLAAVHGLAPEVVAGAGAGTVLFGLAVLATAWAGAVTLVLSRSSAEDVRRVISSGTAGARASATSGLGDELARAAAILDEQGRQIAELARQAQAVELADGPRAAARQVVLAARSVTGDPTWTLVVLQSPDPSLPAGVYGAGAAEGTPIDEVHRWAGTADVDDEARIVQRVEGPWGAFVAVRIPSSDLRSMLLAPHEGRTEPTGSETDLLTLLGELAGATLDKALLYGRVTTQASELERLNAVQRDFLRSVTHDLQTPLTSIRALAQELAAGLPPTGQDGLGVIAYQADRLRRMVAQLLTVSRLEAGALQPRQEVFRAEPIVRTAWAALRADRPFELRTAGVEHLVVADPDRYEQVLWALLDNAVKYSPPGSPIGVSIAGQDDGAQLVSRTEVEDHGIGMTAEERRRAFEQFYRADTAKRLVPDGTGIGLHAARGLVEAMGGSVSVASTPGGPTTVTVELPAEPMRAADTASADG